MQATLRFLPSALLRLAPVIGMLVPLITFAKSPGARSDPFVTTYGALKASELPMCGQ
jgi:hypothetical protein